jgi:hypothetical protein
MVSKPFQPCLPCIVDMMANYSHPESIDNVGECLTNDVPPSHECLGIFFSHFPFETIDRGTVLLGC